MLSLHDVNLQSNEPGCHKKRSELFHLLFMLRLSLYERLLQFIAELGKEFVEIINSLRFEWSLESKGYCVFRVFHIFLQVFKHCCQIFSSIFQ